MKRFVLGLLLVLLLVLGASSASLAAPPVSGTGVFLFGEYAPLFGFEPINAFVAGVGYGFTDNFAAGLQVQIFESEFILGGFANVGIGPFSIDGEFCLLTPPSGAETRLSDSFGESLAGRIKAAYNFKLDPVQLSIGAGALFFLGSGPPSVPFFIEGTANVRLSDSFSIYGKLDYYLNPSFLWNMTYDFGVSLAL